MKQHSFPKDKIKIVLLEDIHPKAVEAFKADGFTDVTLLPVALEGQALINQIHAARVVGIRSRTHVSKAVLDSCPKLMALGCFCIGTNQVDLKEAMLRGIPVFNDPHSNTRSVAEMVIGLCVALMRDLFGKSTAAHQGHWKKSAKGSHELRGRTLGIVGYGRIGSQVSVLAESLGMQIVYYDIDRKLSLGNARPQESLEELLKAADIVTLHVPETPLTQKMISRRELTLMKKGACLINTSRGGVLDNEALAEALAKGAIKGAAVDVFPAEPEGREAAFVNPLQGLDNAILTPHIAGATEEAQENIGLAIAHKLIHFVNRGSTEGAANFPELALPPHDQAHRILHIHQNMPGMLFKINAVMAEREINILGQFLRTKDEVGYVVLDIATGYKNHFLEALNAIPGTISTRVLY